MAPTVSINGQKKPLLLTLHVYLKQSRTSTQKKTCVEELQKCGGCCSYLLPEELKNQLCCFCRDCCNDCRTYYPDMEECRQCNRKVCCKCLNIFGVCENCMDGLDNEDKFENVDVLFL
jgi:hypothetical protein